MDLKGNMGGCSFINVGSDYEMDITDLSVTGYGDSLSEGFEIQTLDDHGYTLKQYQWHDFTKKKVLYKGWYDFKAGRYVEPGEVKFPAGKGLWIYTTVDNLKLVCNGEVITQAYGVKLQDKGLMVANPTPVDIKLMDMWASGYGDSISEGIEVQTLDDHGYTLKQYQWHDFTKKKVAYYGWYDFKAGKYVKDLPQEEQDAIIVKAGKGLWAYCAMPDGFQYILNFPAVVTEK